MPTRQLCASKCLDPWEITTNHRVNPNAYINQRAMHVFCTWTNNLNQQCQCHARFWTNSRSKSTWSTFGKPDIDATGLYLRFLRSIVIRSGCGFNWKVCTMLVMKFAYPPFEIYWTVKMNVTTMLRHHLGSNSLSTGYSTWQQWSLFASQRGSSPTKAYRPCLRRWTGSREGYWQLCASVSSLYKKLLIKVLWRPVCIGLDCMKDCSQRNGNGSSKMIWLLRSFIAPSVQLERVCKLLLFVWYCVNRTNIQLCPNSSTTTCLWCR